MGPEVGVCFRGAPLCPQCASPSSEKGRQGCRAHGARLSHHTHLWDVRQVVGAAWPTVTGQNPPPCPEQEGRPASILQSRALASKSMAGAGNREPGPFESPGACVCLCVTDRQTDGQPLGTHNLGSVCDGVCKSECPAHPAWWLRREVVCLSVWLGVCVHLCLSCDIMSAWVD